MNGIARASRGVGALAAALLLASCGGGSSEVFNATRVIAFGDELSVINADGSKYGVNALATDSATTLDCALNPIWIQEVASSYGLAFPECPGTAVDPVGRIRAANGATVADLAGQIDQQIADGGIVAGDLVTVLVGANDVVAQFQQYPGVGEAQITANLDAAGTELAAQVNRLAALGAKVLIATIPRMGLTPFAGDRSTGSTDPNPALLTRLSTRFNDSLLLHLENDGRKIGLVQLEEYLLASDSAALAKVGVYSNSTLPACTVALPGCTSATLVADAITGVFVWADDRHFGPTVQINLGTLAISRSRNNPF
ncbi:MAG: SGNH/GDSL hydrolase family protein [Burkholderiaceae bacterium]